MQRPRPWTVVRWAIGAVVVVAALYLVAANVILNTGAGRALVSSRSVRVDYRSGYSLWPGSAHLRDVDVRARRRGDAPEAWRVKMDRVDADVRVLPLLAGRVHARRVLADRVSITTDAFERERPRPAPPSLVAARPRDGDDRTAERPNRRREPLLVVDDVELTQLERVNAEDVDYVGTANARGALRLGRRGDVDFERARADVLSGELRIGGRSAAQNLAGRVEITRLHVAHDRSTAASVLESFEGGVELASAVPGGAPISPEGAGTARISVRVVGGALTRGSTAELHMPPVLVDTRAGRVELAGDVAVAAGERETVLAGMLRDVRFTPSHAGEAEGAKGAAHMPSVALHATTPTLRLASPLADANVSVEIPELTGDVSMLPFVPRMVEPANARIERGNATLTFEGGVVSGKLTARTEPVIVTLGEASLAGALTCDIDLDSASTTSEHVEGRVRLRLEDGEARTPVASVTLDEVKLGIGAPSRTLDAKVHVEMRSAEPFLRYVTRGAELPGLLDMLLASQPLVADAKLSADADDTRLTDLDAAAGPVHAVGRLVTAGGATTSTLLLTAGPLAVGVDADGAKTSLMLVGAREWFDAAMQEPAPPVGTTSTTGADVQR